MKDRSKDAGSRDTRAIFISKVQELAYEMKVEQVMSPTFVSVPPETPMDDIRKIMQKERISGLPVSKDGMVVGILSIEDLINYLAAGGKGLSVSEKMSRNVTTVFRDDPVTRAVNIFDMTGFGRLPVLERGTGVLKGVITKGDIVKGFLKRLEVEYHEEEIHRYRASHFFEDIVADKATLTFHYGVKGGDFSKAGTASSGLKKTLSRLGLKPDSIRRVAIASYEAEMNMVIYSKGGRLSAEVTPEIIKVTATDVGPGIPDIERAMQPGYSTASPWVREMGFGAGMGLPNIKKCSDHMVVNSVVGTGTTVEFIVGV